MIPTRAPVLNVLELPPVVVDAAKVLANATVVVEALALVVAATVLVVEAVVAAAVVDVVENEVVRVPRSYRQQYCLHR